MSATSDDLRWREQKCEEREARLTQREQEFSARPAVRDLAWEADIRRREEKVGRQQAELNAKALALEDERKQVKTLREAAEALRNEGLATQVNLRQREEAVRQREADVAKQHDGEVTRHKCLDDREASHQAVVSLWQMTRSGKEAALVEREKAFDVVCRQREGALDAREAALNRRQVAQEAVATAQANLQTLLEQERSPALDVRETAIVSREAKVALRETAATTKEAENRLSSEQQASEARRIEGLLQGLDEREALVERREAEVTRREQTVGNREATLKAKQG